MSLLVNQSYANPSRPLWASADASGGGVGPTGPAGSPGATGPTGPAGGGGGGAQIQTFFEAQPSGTSGGAVTVLGSYFTRTLNTGSPALSGSNSTTISGMSLSSNTVTLPAGTYLVSGSTPAFGVNRHKSQVYNLTNSNVIILGQSSYSDSGGQVQVDSGLVEGVFTLSTSAQVQLQQQVEQNAGPLSLGVPTNFGDNEIYSTVTFEKIA